MSSVTGKCQLCTINDPQPELIWAKEHGTNTARRSNGDQLLTAHY